MLSKSKYFILVFFLLYGCGPKQTFFEFVSKQTQDAAIQIKTTINTTDTLIYFTIEVTRNFNIENEYLPDNGSININIFSEDRALLAKIPKKTNKLQSNHKILPLEIGEIKIYNFSWDIQKDKIPKNVTKFNAIVTIPAMPNNYQEMLFFER